MVENSDWRKIKIVHDYNLFKLQNKPNTHIFKIPPRLQFFMRQSFFFPWLKFPENK
jgi:hypothetical protein